MDDQRLAMQAGERISIPLYPSRFNVAPTRTSLMGALLRAKRRHGGKTKIIHDADGRSYTYNDLVRASFAMGSVIKRNTKPGDSVAILLPTGAGAAITFFAISAYGRVPAMLNFTAGSRALIAACKACVAKRIVTARKFIEVAGLQDLIDTLSQHVEIMYLEDAREQIGRTEKAAAIVGDVAPVFVRSHPRPDDTGVILFTSGTEGDPKGVVLSHANLLSNVEQVRGHLDSIPNKIFFNPLPTFHCFGLTGGLLVPLLMGYPTVLHPSPLHAKTIAKRIGETGATILFATDTFLSQYARIAAPEDMSSLLFAVCGAERVRDETRALVRRKFGLEVLEGYGATEAAPVVSLNHPEDNHPGSVGALMPGLEGRIDPEPGITGAGRLFVRGPNVMAGYLMVDAPGELKPLDGGWHDTGDIVSVDKEGRLTIRGRLKRFAKIGGELISLAVVENCASSLWPENVHASIAVPDPKKGEQVILITDYPQAERGDMIAFAKNHGVPELAVPRRIICVEEIPVLGTGKIDYAGVSKLLANGESVAAAAPAPAPEPEPAPTTDAPDEAATNEAPVETEVEATEPQE